MRQRERHSGDRQMRRQSGRERHRARERELEGEKQSSEAQKRETWGNRGKINKVIGRGGGKRGEE
jgi:hypothetical protein